MQRAAAGGAAMRSEQEQGTARQPLSMNHSIQTCVTQIAQQNPVQKKWLSKAHTAPQVPAAVFEQRPRGVFQIFTTKTKPD
jgi:hypothetical protein